MATVLIRIPSLWSDDCYFISTSVMSNLLPYLKVRQPNAAAVIKFAGHSIPRDWSLAVGSSGSLGVYKAVAQREVLNQA